MKNVPLQDVLYQFTVLYFSTARQVNPLNKREIDGDEKLYSKLQLSLGFSTDWNYL